jgi:hypothetical protein
MWECKNAHVTRGGDVEKRKKFVTKWSLPAGTFGLKVVDGTGYVFGSLPSAAITPSLPSGTSYQRLASPSTAATAPSMSRVYSAVRFDGDLYVIAGYDDDNIHHFHAGEHVTDWDDGIVQTWTTALSEIAAQIALRINENTAEKATATSSGNVITITAKVVNLALNVTAEATNGGSVTDETVAVSITTAHGGGTAEVCTVTLGGTLDIGDRFAVTLSPTGFTSYEYGAGGTPLTKATVVVPHKSKLYALGSAQDFGSSIVRFCSLDDATSWREGVDGAGFLNVATSEEGNLDLHGAAQYQQGMAFFAEDAIQTWSLDADPANNAVQESMPNTGALAGGAVVTYGNNDTFYLSRSGIRSLRARDSSNAPFVSDVGNPIDPLIIARRKSLGTTVTAASLAWIEPEDGRLCVAMGDRIYVLSHFPGSKISAWSWYEPGFSIDAVSVDSGKVYVRSGDTVYLYGGDDGDTYDTDANDMYEVVVGLPFIAGKRIAHDKTVNAYDAAIVNEWLVEALVDPRNENRKVVLGTIDEDTYPDQIMPASLTGTTFALQYTCSTAGAASITNMALHVVEAEPPTSA